ncbi:hypothetical protein CSA56_17615 [candidate division KSB3 bacterium]|uniref:Uncharacterized protein n=1 Tax=candidate division KSB3 bacterium TaxID=2044937 RepID=A0A2G6K8G7_9BACT|nr:MAG: hypothetical protein CSA56_17615 [candidate division KSB3 bacterium]
MSLPQGIAGSIYGLKTASCYFLSALVTAMVADFILQRFVLKVVINILQLRWLLRNLNLKPNAPFTDSNESWS